MTRDCAYLSRSTETVLEHVEGSELDVSEPLGLALHVVDDLDRQELQEDRTCRLAGA